MPSQGVVTGQKVDPVKLERAREFRRQMTPEEAILWKHLRGNRLGLHFRRQQIICGFIVDYYCHAANLAIEVDGDVHATQAEYDAERDAVLAASGIRTLRIGNEDIRNNLASALGIIAAAIATIPP